METINNIASNPNVMMWSGAIVLAMLGFGFMRVRRHSVKDSLCFGGGILGVIVVLSLIRYLFFR